jgi:hypothetical protein
MILCKASAKALARVLAIGSPMKAQSLPACPRADLETRQEGAWALKGRAMQGLDSPTTFE